jgi:hypothetical protein
MDDDKNFNKYKIPKNGIDHLVLGEEKKSQTGSAQPSWRNM